MSNDNIKSIEARLSISQFAKLTGISKSTLMYYDNIGLFSPLMRGSNNYRYYALNQITAINQIRVLSSLGMPVKMMQELVHDRKPETIQKLIKGSFGEIDAQIDWMRKSRKLAETVSELIDMGIEAEKSGEEFKISVIQMAERNILVGRKNEWKREESFFKKFGDFLSISMKEGHNAAFPIGGMFESLSTYLENSSLPDRFFYIYPDGKETRPAGKYLVGYARGYYGVAGDIAVRMNDYSLKHKLKAVGPVYNVYLLDEISVADPNNYLMRASVRVE
ncbi:MAG: MerR family DNA-binding transcriptional regulator [Clostridiales Family XIII bacterium]|jgi:DNA-binding transcriptional MerR regulator|nr:MerR family DNA-binding transcriptional regulator [Clostridiales Family XIII bacterium]